VDEVESVTITESPQVMADFFDGELEMQRHQAIETEHGIVQIAFTGPVAKGSVRVDLTANERLYKVARITQQLG